MTAIGFDIGNKNCVIAVAKKGGIDVLLNDESKRETPAVVSFGEKQRFLGSSGAAFATTNPKSTISQIKRLIGARYNEPSVQKELRFLPFETSLCPRGGVLIHLQYLVKPWTFRPMEILGMLFAHMKQVTEKNRGSPIVNCVIGIPSYFTDLQRRDYLDAASIAGLKPLQLMHDCTAIALGYGMYKTDFSTTGPINVIFVDVGHSDTQVTVAAFRKGKMSILSHSFDQHLGGRDFDEVLFRHFAAKFTEQYNIDVYTDARASIRLRKSCEKLKKVLSANAEATLSIECLMDDKDVNGSITREEFESLSLELLERFTLPCCMAVNDSGISADKIHIIELVGSGSRIPAIVRRLTLLFNKEPMRTLNGSECVARGCALRCAMLSPTFRVPDYEVQDLFPYTIGVHLDDTKNKRQQEIILKGSPFPSEKTVAHHGYSGFYSQVFYTSTSGFPTEMLPRVGIFLIGPSPTSGAEEVVVKVKVQLNINGIIEIESASLIEDKQPISNKHFLYSWVVKDNNLVQNDASDHKSVGCGSSTEHHAQKIPRGRARMQNLPVSENWEVMIMKDEICAAQMIQQMLAEHDIKVEKIKDKRNTLEAFIYDTRSKLLSSYRSVTTDLEAEEISKSLQGTEDWLYEEGDDESEEVYIRKHENLKKLLDPIESRYKDEIARIEATKALRTCIDECRSAADSLPSSQKKEVKNKCIQAEKWLTSLSQLQDELAKNATPTYCSSAISGITQVFMRRCKDMIRSKQCSQKCDDRKRNPNDMQVNH